MFRKRTSVIRLLVLSILMLVAATAFIPIHHLTSYDVIASINALRASYGLPSYAVDDRLMLAAQRQADYLASIAPNVGDGHVGPGGTDADARALAAGYSYVVGLDINENWAGIPVNSSIENLIATGWSDEAHMHTMLHERGQHIGVGVAVSGSTAYIIVDVAAYWGDSGLTAQPADSYASTNGNDPVVSNYIVPVVLAEPNEDGSVIHIVQSGQSLWMLVPHYGVTIDQLRELNQIGEDDNVIYIGQEIIIKPPSPATATPETMPSITAVPQPTITQKPANTPDLTEKKSSDLAGNDMNLIYLLFFAIFGVGLILVVVGIQQR
ncbi:MAG: CAP domain-containing protein [Pelolinea sp.]|nr:CAP domain-containing protein [Pelolinea sp.]